MSSSPRFEHDVTPNAPRRQRVLLLLPAASYRNDAFRAAAASLKIEAVAAADYCRRLAPQWGLDPLLALPFDRPRQALAIALRHLGAPPDAVLAVDDHGVELAALLTRRLGLQGNPPRAVRAMRDKLTFRNLLARQRLNCPWFRRLDSHADPARLRALRFPLVVKARRLAASRGVIRADNRSALERAVARVRRIQACGDCDAARLGLILEQFITGPEYALEGLLTHGRLRVLALFDKPDPLNGPYFEETLYVTPARLDPRHAQAAASAVEAACRGAGLRSGPIHAEFRVHRDGVWLLEIAPRSIGGLCGAMLTQALGMTLEELILRHALGRALPAPRGGTACGAMMIPIPQRGIFERIDGIDQALALDGITDLRVTAMRGQLLVPPPEGGAYLGFIFARGGSAAMVEGAMRRAHACLVVRLRPEVPLRVAA